jgi:pimeloyl-ACP methyl ester carboxylesterase
MPKFLSIDGGGATCVGEKSSGDVIAYMDNRRNNVQPSAGASVSLPPIVFLPGYRSVMTGTKAMALHDYCQRSGRRFIRFDYRGHGASSGDFLKLALSDWIDDALLILDTLLLGEQPPILVGSSMGAWIAFCVAQQRYVAGIVGLGAAVDFTQDLYESLTSDELVSLEHEDVVWRPSSYNTEFYPFTKRFFDDAQRWTLLNDNASKKSKQYLSASIANMPVRLIHGMRDDDISFTKSVEIANKIHHDDVVVTLIKIGDHRLSTPRDLKQMLHAINSIAS